MPIADTNKVVILDSCSYWGHNEAPMYTTVKLLLTTPRAMAEMQRLIDHLMFLYLKLFTLNKNMWIEIRVFKLEKVYFSSNS